MKKFSYIITFFFCWVMAGQSNPEISVQVDTPNIKIGDQLTFSIAAPKEASVTFPSLELDGLEVAKELDEETVKDKVVKKYLITGFDSGAFYIKKQEIFIDAKSYFTDSLLINVGIIKVDTSMLNQYINLKEAEKDKVTFAEIRYRYENYLYIALGVLAFIILIYFLFRKEKEEKPVIIPKIPPYITATKELKELQTKELWQNNQVKEYYSELTDIVRKYIGGELSIQALENTTDELISLLQVENKEQGLGLEKELVEKLKGLLSQADFVKFAKQKPIESDIRGHESDAKLIINTIHKIVESKKKQEENEEQ
ncbi:hypothetical protein [Wenyingzhuangia sp. IMCC45574]